MVTAGDDPFSRSVAALGYFDVWYAHAYATGIADVEITNVDEVAWPLGIVIKSEE